MTDRTEMEMIFEQFSGRMKTVYETHRGLKHNSWKDLEVPSDLDISLEKAAHQVSHIIKIAEEESEFKALDDISKQALMEQAARECIDVANWAMFLWWHLAGLDDGY